jgi:hypothetical protein
MIVWLISVVLVLVGDAIFVVNGKDQETLTAAQGDTLKSLLGDLACTDCGDLKMAAGAGADATSLDFQCPQNYATCANKLVVALDFSSNSLAGSLSETIAKLTGLTRL